MRLHELLDYDLDIMKLTRLALMFAGAVCAPAQRLELNTTLMKSTFEIMGPAANGKGISFGTAFLMGKQATPDSLSALNVLVTAAHVLGNIKGDTASLLLRKADGKGLYTPYAFPLKIRENGRNLYTKHQTADVAVMYVGLPRELGIVELLPLTALLEDEALTEVDLHPGDELFCLGFARPGRLTRGFPVLRSGRLASYPLTPAKTIGTWTYDATLYEGNSGGPVYFTFQDRQIHGETHVGMYQGIVGLIGGQSSSTNAEVTDKPLSLSIIVPAIFIRETIDELL